MSTRDRAFRATHAPQDEFTSVLGAFHSAGQAAPLTEQAIVRLARDVHLPVAAVRGAISSYDDSRLDPNAIRVCAGTSCMLAGGGRASAELAKHHPCHPVYCLGYCDRSPAAMTSGGKVVTGFGPASFDDVRRDHALPHPPPPAIRCTARHAVVTARLLQQPPQGVELPEYTGLRAALGMTPQAVIDTLSASGERGRGGAAFPTAKKWQLAAQAPGTPKFIVANGDEGDPGSFIDRELMERDPHAILEGMAIAAHAVGASRGVVFIRSEYPVSSAVMTRAIADATAAGALGEHALGRHTPFVVEVVRGMGSYVCGEETALLAAIEGQRGEVRPRPPYPVQSGLFGRPTVVDNVETLANVPWIMTRGAPAYAAMGTPESRGTKAVCLNHGFAQPGIVEVEFGVSLRHVIEELGGGGRDGVELEAVLLGGPMGSIVTPDQWDVPVCFTAMARKGINLGHAGIVAIPKPADWGGMLRHLLTFMRDESCGKCTPCRLGSARAHEIAKSGLTPESRPQFDAIMALMGEASLCAFGRETPGPIRTILERFGDRVMVEVSR